MVTDRPPHKEALLAEFLASEKLRTLAVPEDDRLRTLASAIDSTMKAEKGAAVRHACTEFVESVSAFHKVRAPQIRVLAARPLRVREGGWSFELFGDYTPETVVIRIWMRTAVRKQITSFGTFLSTLCHEFCHHLDFQKYGFHESPHTRGFYERAAALYHHTRGTPLKRLFWAPMPGGRCRIDWPRTNRRA